MMHTPTLRSRPFETHATVVADRKHLKAA